MSHPAACRNPSTCSLSYVDHLRGFGVAAEAMPTRGVNRDGGLPPEPLIHTVEREKRWEREGDAFKTLCDAGREPETLAEAPHRLRELGG